MKGVILTATGQPLATPSPAEFVRMFAKPLNGAALDFQRMFEEGSVDDEEASDANTTAQQEPIRTKPSETVNERSDKVPPMSPAKIRTVVPTSPSKGLTSTVKPIRRSMSVAPPALRRPPSTLGMKKTISSSGKARVPAGTTEGDEITVTSRRESSVSKPERETTAPSNSTSSASTVASTSSGSDTTIRRARQIAKSSNAESAPRKITRANTVASIPTSKSSERLPQYDLDDEANLPSPFLKRIERERPVATVSDRLTRTRSAAASTTNGVAAGTRSATLNGRVKSSAASSAASGSAATGSSASSARRMSSGNLLRAVAAANAAAVKDDKEEAEKETGRPAPTNTRRATETSRQRLKA
jgi:hypothetical protein